MRQRCTDATGIGCRTTGQIQAATDNDEVEMPADAGRGEGDVLNPFLFSFSSFQKANILRRQVFTLFGVHLFVFLRTLL